MVPQPKLACKPYGCNTIYQQRRVCVFIDSYQLTTNRGLAEAKEIFPMQCAQVRPLLKCEGSHSIRAIDKLEKFPIRGALDERSEEAFTTDKGWEALKLAYSFLTQLKKNKSKATRNDFRVNITYLSPRVLPNQIGGFSLGDTLRSFLEDSIMCSIEFAFISPRGTPMVDDDPISVDPQVNLPLELFGVFLQDFYHCTLVRLQNDVTMLQAHFKRWVSPKAYTAVLKFPRLNGLKPSETIACDIKQEILNHIAITPTTICSCCKQRTEKIDYCSKRKIPLGGSETCSVYSVGPVALKFLCSNEDAPENSTDIVLSVERRIPLQSISTSLLHDQPYLLTDCSNERFEWEELLLNNERLQATCQLLLEKESGLLVSATQDISAYGPTFSPLTLYFLLIPEATCGSRSLLMRRIAVSEQILPMSLVEEHSPIDADTLAKASEMLDSVPEEEYNPLNYEMKFHQRVNSFIKSSRATKSMPLATLPKVGPTRRNSSLQKPVLFSSTVTPANPTDISPQLHAARPTTATKARTTPANNKALPSPFDFTEE